MENEENKTNGAAAPAIPESIAAPKVQGRILGSMTSEERLRAENISLKNEKAQLLSQVLEQQAMAISDLKRQAFEEAVQLKKEICERFNIADPGKIALRMDGSIEEKA